jgi:aerobic carbon-monoxide dehydrogenase small subunit
MKRSVTLTVNGSSHTILAEPRTLLVHALRDDLHLTGTHIGCDTSQCGACTVLIDGRAVKSCTVLAVQAEGREVTTIEGIGTAERLHPVQQAFWDKHGLQCGFCTPGMIMSAIDLLAANPDPTDDQIRHGLEGNMCRCTGYQNIVASVRAAAEAMRGSDAFPAAAPRHTARQVGQPAGAGV